MIVSSVDILICVKDRVIVGWAHVFWPSHEVHYQARP